MNQTTHHQEAADRAVTAVAAAAGRARADTAALRQLRAPLRGLLPGEPNTWRDAIAAALPPATPVVLTGTLERRLLAIDAVHAGGPAPGWGDIRDSRDAGRWVLADLSGQPHTSRHWPAWAHNHVQLDDPQSWLSDATLTSDAARRLTRPRIVLAALYRREVFPLPRFSLSVCDLARAARATLSGHVHVLDMQLGITIPDILAAAAPAYLAGTSGTNGMAADVLGVSATFGQHDLLREVLDAVFAVPDPPLVLAGGSLTARNERLLLTRYPELLVARGAGESTIADTIAYWHGDLTREQIRGVGYASAPTTGARVTIDMRAAAVPVRIARTAGIPNRDQGDYLPELDLLNATFAAGGVAQLETSRGCTSSCSFCPRGHKGSWAGADPTTFTTVLAEMGAVFDRHPEIARVLYLVDEEFIGADPDAVPRVQQLAQTMHADGYRWETSCRVDQIAQPAADRTWHVERARLWRNLRAHGLRRCLFGIESGVTSILQRFHKQTTAEQNVQAIRTLSALGIPTRYTYITFDQLMTLDELTASHAFQGRTDLILRPLPHLEIEQIVDGVQDPEFVATHTTGEPFYRGISYMLVSMECLIGAAYTRRVQAAGLAGAPRPSMGRVDANFADPRIGICSDLAQRWVDRHFTLDYTLKSLEKALDGPPLHALRGAREVFKDAGYDLLGDMITTIRPPAAGPSSAAPDRTPHNLVRTRVQAALNTRHERLREALATTITALGPTLPPASAAVLNTEYDRWQQTTGWPLINDTAACTT